RRGACGRRCSRARERPRAARRCRRSYSSGRACPPALRERRRRSPGNRGTPAREPSTPAGRQTPSPIRPLEWWRWCTSSRRHTAGRRPSEFLPPDEVPDDDCRREGGQNDREEDEEKSCRPGLLGRVAAEAVDRIHAAAAFAALQRRPVLPDPEENADDQDDDEAPQPGEIEPMDVPRCDLVVG